LSEPRKTPYFQPPPRREGAVLDSFLEGDLDWRKAVQTHPLPALTLAALGGAFLGKRYGMELFTDLSAFAARELLRGLESALGGEASDSSF
jgi:hypothetical protein